MIEYGVPKIYDKCKFLPIQFFMAFETFKMKQSSNFFTFRLSIWSVPWFHSRPIFLANQSFYVRSPSFPGTYAILISKHTYQYSESSAVRPKATTTNHGDIVVRLFVSNFNQSKWIRSRPETPPGRVRCVQTGFQLVIHPLFHHVNTNYTTARETNLFDKRRYPLNLFMPPHTFDFSKYVAAPSCHATTTTVRSTENGDDYCSERSTVAER